MSANRRGRAYFVTINRLWHDLQATFTPTYFMAIRNRSAHFGQ
jgi:hypothetical protein